MADIHTILVGQSGGPTAAVNASLAGVISAARKAQIHILGIRYGIEGLLDGHEPIDLTETLPTKRDLELLARTPSSYLGSCRYKLPDMYENPSDYEQLFKYFDERQADGVLYLGGNDSMDTIDKLSAYGAQHQLPQRFVGVPKTIDNDLMEIDHTPGYGSAAKFVATCVSEIARDSSVYDLKSATVVEIMGRDAGWLAASAALASAPELPCPDLILLPERPVTAEALCKRVRELLERKNTVVIASSEELHTPEGVPLSEAGAGSVTTDAFGHKASLSGTSRYLASAIQNKLHVKTRAVELSTLQRSASHCASACDLKEAYKLGAAGVNAVLAGKTGVMTTLVRDSDLPYATHLETVAVSKVANKIRTMPDALISEDGMNVTQAYLDYARPLISGEVSQLTIDGIPAHIAALDPLEA